MFPDDPRVNPLTSRKQLLIAESDINRAQLVQELQSMTEGFHTLSHRVKSVSALASTAALLVVGVAAFRRGKSMALVARPSWFQLALKGAQMASSLRSLRRQRHDR
jgi:hypothetical protein